MTWFHRRPKPGSNAEEDIQKELQKRGRDKAKLDYMETQKGFRFDPHKDGVAGTRVDFYWHPPFFYAVYIDGIQVHSSLHRQTKDELINEALERRGINWDRFRYKAPLRKARKLEICDNIIKRLSQLMSDKAPRLNHSKTITLSKKSQYRTMLDKF